MSKYNFNTNTVKPETETVTYKNSHVNVVKWRWMASSNDVGWRRQMTLDGVVSKSPLLDSQSLSRFDLQYKTTISEPKG